MNEANPKPGTVAYVGKNGGTPGQIFAEFVGSLATNTVLTPRERELVYIGIHTAHNLENSLRAHIPRALQAGATKEELAAAMMIAVANGGVNGALIGLPILFEEH